MNIHLFGLNCYLIKLWNLLRNVSIKFFKNLKSHFSWHTGVFSSFRQLFKKLLLKKIGSQNGWKKQESSKSLKSILFPLYPCFSSLEKNCSKKKNFLYTKVFVFRNVIKSLLRCCFVANCWQEIVVIRKHTTSHSIGWAQLVSSRGGVKLGFIRNSFNSIEKFAINMIWKGKTYSKNLMKINSNSFHSIQLQL